MQSLSLHELKTFKEQGGLIIDTRASQIFRERFIQESINIPFGSKFEGRIALFVQDQDVVLIADDNDQLNDVIDTFNQLKKGQLKGFYTGGIAAWEAAGEPVDMIIGIDPYELSLDLNHDPKLHLIDVRPFEIYQMAHVQSAVNMSMDDLKDIAVVASIDEDSNVYVYCGGGSSAILAASIIKRQGYQSVYYIIDGFKGIKSIESIQIVEQKDKLN